MTIKRKSRAERILRLVRQSILDVFRGDLSPSRRKADEVKVVDRYVKLADRATAARYGNAVVLVMHDGGIPSPEETFDVQSGESTWDIVDEQLRSDLPDIALGREELSDTLTAFYDLGDREDEDDVGPTGTRRISMTSSAFGPTGTKKIGLFRSNPDDRLVNLIQKMLFDDVFDRQIPMAKIKRSVFSAKADPGRNAPDAAVVIIHSYGIPSPEEMPENYEQFIADLHDMDLGFEEVNSEVSAVYGEY